MSKKHEQDLEGDDEPVSDIGIDFTANGMTLNEWLGMLPHDAVLKAADIALRRPDEKIIVGIARNREPLIMPRWSTRERGLLKTWYRTEQPDTPGRLRLGTTTELDPKTSQDYSIAYVVHEPNYTPPGEAGVTVKPDVLKHLAELVDGDSWQVADLLVEQFSVEEYGDAASGSHSGLHAVLDEYEDALRRERGIELKVATMRSYRATALNWPPALRRAPDQASFTAHRALAGEKRQAEMERFLRKNKGRALSRRDVARHRADENTTPVKPWDVRARARIESTVKSLLLGAIITKRDDWWEAGPDESRVVLIEMLRELATRMEGM